MEKLRHGAELFLRFGGVRQNGGICYVWGSNDHGQLAQDPGLCRNVLGPRLVVKELFCGATLDDIYSGWTHMLAITKRGELYSWGRNDYGQLGRTTTSKIQEWSPGLVEDVKNPKQVYVGSEHSVAVMSNNCDKTLYTWGWNEHGICGNGSEENVLLPTAIKTIDSTHQFILLGGGCGHNFVMIAPES